MEVTYQLGRFPEEGALEVEEGELKKKVGKLNKRAIRALCEHVGADIKRMETPGRSVYLLITIKFRCKSKAEVNLTQVIHDCFAPAWYIPDGLLANKPGLLLRSWQVRVTWPKKVILNDSDQTLILEKLRDRLRPYGTPDPVHTISQKWVGGTNAAGFWFRPVKRYGAEEVKQIAVIVESQLTYPAHLQGKMEVSDANGNIALDVKLAASSKSKGRAQTNCTIL